jgi:hypothetical protein
MAIVRHQKTGECYEYLGDNFFQNIRTLEKGIVPTETAQNIFKIQPEMTILINDFPNIKNLVSTLNLKVETIINNK